MFTDRYFKWLEQTVVLFFLTEINCCMLIEYLIFGIKAPLFFFYFFNFQNKNETKISSSAYLCWLIHLGFSSPELSTRLSWLDFFFFNECCRSKRRSIVIILRFFFCCCCIIIVYRNKFRPILICCCSYFHCLFAPISLLNKQTILICTWCAHFFINLISSRHQRFFFRNFCKWNKT